MIESNHECAKAEVDFGEGNIKRILFLYSDPVPFLFASALNADALAIAMEARGYKGVRDEHAIESTVGSEKDTLALLIISVSHGLLFYLKMG